MILDSISEIYLQEVDSCSGSHDPQALRVKTFDAGGGPYLAISTRRWAMNREDIPKLVALLEGVLDRVEAQREKHENLYRNSQ